MYLPFNFATILSQLFIFVLTLLCLSACIPYHQSNACPFILVTTNFTFYSSDTFSYSKYFSKVLIQSINSSTFKLPSYSFISILGLEITPMIALINFSSTPSSSGSAPSSTSAIYSSSLTSPKLAPLH